jgi:predicted phosphodiesterase
MQLLKIKTGAFIFRYLLVSLLAAVHLLAFQVPSCFSGRPGSAVYSLDNSKTFWFLVIADAHTGEDPAMDARLTWVLRDAYPFINPQFVINIGDLTNQHPLENTAPNDVGEWLNYDNLVSGFGIENYIDAPGNHDQYHESGDPLGNYLQYSNLGRADNNTQNSWVYSTPFGKYHFMTIATPDPNMTDPQTDFLNSCPGEMDAGRLAFIESELQKYSDADLTFVFGHHTLGGWGMIRQGLDELLNDFNNYGVSSYIYGHTHLALHVNNYFVNPKSSPTLAYNVASVGFDGLYSVVAVDNNGLSVTDVNGAAVGTWPVVLITAPTDASLGGNNPYAYTVPRSDSNPIRALIFSDPGYAAVSSVWALVDGIKAGQMFPVSGNSGLWEGTFDASRLSPGTHRISAKAECVVESTSAKITGSQTIKVSVKAGKPGKITGALYKDTLAGPGVQGARVSCAGRSTVSGKDGKFELSGVPSGFQKLTFSKPNYVPIKLIATVPEGNVYDVGAQVMVQKSYK